MKKPHKKRRKNRPVVKAPAATTETQQKHTKLSKREMRAYADLTASDPRFKILYLIPHFPQDLREASVLGWYSPALLHAAEPLLSIATWPADIREPFSPQYAILTNRLTRRIWPKVIPVEFDALVAGAHLFDSPFRVFVSNDPAMAKEIDAFINQSGWLCLHISSIDGGGRLLIGDFSIKKLLDYFMSVVNVLSVDANWASFARIAKKEMNPQHVQKTHRHSLPRGLHNVTEPNEAALSAFGWMLHRSDPISNQITPGGHNPQRYVDRICRSASAVSKARSQLIKNIPPELYDYRYIIAVQSMYWGHFTDWRKLLSKSGDVDKKILRLALGFTIQATTYFDYIKVEDNLLSNPVFRYFQNERTADARSFTAGLTILAAASLAPVLRLEPKLNQVCGDLKQLANCVRAMAHHHFDWKQSRLASRLGEKMRSLVNPSFLALIDKPEAGPIEGLKLVSDLPLELMRSGGAATIYAL